VGKKKRHVSNEMFGLLTKIYRAGKLNIFILGIKNTYFLFYFFLPAALGPGIYSASNKNEYQKQKKKCLLGGECNWHVRLTTSLPSVY
jgi:hypothetical protein